MKLCETKKLHYGKYIYKLAIVNSCAYFFRTEYQPDGNLKYARQRLDNVSRSHKQQTTEWGIQVPTPNSRFVETIPFDHFWDAIEIYRHLIKEKEYKIRCEATHLIIYSNNRKGMIELGNKLKQPYTEFWEPNPETIQTLLSEENIIISNKPPVYQYKVTLGNKKGSANLAKWIEANPNLASMGAIALEYCKDESYVYGYYFHVRDEKTLLLIQMMVGNNIQRVDKFVYIEQ
tara:strand:- start:1064 stop:1759 length:696 start_codon:yes stop_codon:yes gene_type:complete